MGAFRKFYIVWIVFCISGFVISPAVGHNPNRVYEFFVMLGWIIFPLILLMLYRFFSLCEIKFLYIALLLLLYYPIASILYYMFYYHNSFYVTLYIFLSLFK
ncbi:hypothetical protein E7R50_08480 [Campylobacter jejuni]|nr:hypothetical protein [Campylobacter jejuni]EAI4891149.1 hypothetical protein [Campylobacter coli]KQI19922.1 hypothetical protein Y780_10390 [Campylobacter coli CVM 41915]PJP47191.1 hypothetical protein CV377_09005 [Campylobacter jejuni subsp. jejuni]EAI2863528.1 hypothetical protein [Campylobacter jejuni]